MILPDKCRIPVLRTACEFNNGIIAQDKAVGCLVSVIGTGIEWAFASNWTLQGEYLHIDLGHTDVVGIFLPTPTNNITYRFDYQIDAARIGINYRFGSPTISNY